MELQGTLEGVWGPDPTPYGQKIRVKVAGQYATWFLRKDDDAAGHGHHLEEMKGQEVIVPVREKGQYLNVDGEIRLASTPPAIKNVRVDVQEKMMEKVEDLQFQQASQMPANAHAEAIDILARIFTWSCDFVECHEIAGRYTPEAKAELIKLIFMQAKNLPGWKE